jgi:hypothetical protein
VSESKEEKIGAIIEALSEHVPKLIRSLVDEFYSPESAAKIGKGLAEFYKALIEGGIPEDCALAMTQKYQKNLSIGGMRHFYRPMGRWWRGYDMRHGDWGKYAKWKSHYSGYGEKEESEEAPEE